jgi:hypothetical protein
VTQPGRAFAARRARADFDARARRSYIVDIANAMKKGRHGVHRAPAAGE